MSDDLDPSLDRYVKAALGKKAFDLVILDVRDLTSIADVFIICSGRSNRQVSAIAEFIQVELKKQGLKPYQKIQKAKAFSFQFYLLKKELQL